MKIFIVYEEVSIRDVDRYKILNIFNTEKAANKFHESLPIKQQRYSYVEEHEVIE